MSEPPGKWELSRRNNAENERATRKMVVNPKE
jgi:hypothetical protein